MLTTLPKETLIAATYVGVVEYQIFIYECSDFKKDDMDFFPPFEIWNGVKLGQRLTLKNG